MSDGRSAAFRRAAPTSHSLLTQTGPLPTHRPPIERPIHTSITPGERAFRYIATVNCPLCDQHFPIHGVPCTEAGLMLPIHEKTRVRHQRMLWTGRRPCPECATSPGWPHHMPCDREHCPACCDGQKLISCLGHFLWKALPSPARPPARDHTTDQHLLPGRDWIGSAHEQP
jgi:hypothetical protein